MYPQVVCTSLWPRNWRTSSTSWVLRVKPGRDCPADIVCRLGRFDPCALAQLPDPVINGPDVDPLSLFPEEQIILILKGVMLIDQKNLPDQIDTFLSQGEDTVLVYGGYTV